MLIYTIMEHLLWSTLFLIVIPMFESIQEWKFKPLPSAVNWTRSTSVDYLFQRTVSSSLKCSTLCAEHENCTVYFLENNVCFGTTLLTPDSSKTLISNSKVFNKRPKYVCDHEDFVYYKDLCLLINNDQIYWQDAKSYCEQKGSHLLVLDYDSKYDAITEFVMTYYPISLPDIFVGASDLETEGDWKWITPSAQNYFRFHQGQPNNKDVNFDSTRTIASNCAALRFTSATLIDEICEQPKSFVCEM